MFVNRPRDHSRNLPALQQPGRFPPRQGPTLQVFGGMGFTWECDAHLWFKRAGYDRQMLGGPVAMRARAAGLTGL